jgi:hypothetical protein
MLILLKVLVLMVAPHLTFHIILICVDTPHRAFSHRKNSVLSMRVCLFCVL